MDANIISVVTKSASKQAGVFERISYKFHSFFNQKSSKEIA
jgi:hypothetical protein